MAKSLNVVPAAVLGFEAAQELVFTNNSTKLGVIGYSGVFTTIDISAVILEMLRAKIEAKITSEMPKYSTGKPGSVVRVYSSTQSGVTPNVGDLGYVKPTKNAGGVVVSGQYEVYIFVAGNWQKIFPRT